MSTHIDVCVGMLRVISNLIAFNRSISFLSNVHDKEVNAKANPTCGIAAVTATTENTVGRYFSTIDRQCTIRRDT